MVNLLKFEPPDPMLSTVVASISGGKDSTAMSLWLTEQGIDHTRIFADTGWEHPGTLRYIKEYLPEVLGEIITVKYRGGMPALILNKGMFPARQYRFCTIELKVKPILKALDKIDPERRAISAVGIRAQESVKRAELNEWEHDANGFERWVWRPLIDRSEDWVIDQHSKHGVMPNPLYLNGSSRVGCWPCIFARKAEIKHLAESDAGRIGVIRSLETVVTFSAQQRAIMRGEKGEIKPRTFFQGRNNEAYTIDEAIKWSRKMTRKKDGELFNDPANPGCIRWGLCDMSDEY